MCNVRTKKHCINWVDLSDPCAGYVGLLHEIKKWCSKSIAKLGWPEWPVRRIRGTVVRNQITTLQKLGWPEWPVRRIRGTVVRKQNVTPAKTRVSQSSVSKKRSKSEHRIHRCMQKPCFWNSWALRLATPLEQNPYLLTASKIDGRADPGLLYYL